MCLRVPEGGVSVLTSPDRMSALNPPFGLSVKLRMLGTVVYGKMGGMALAGPAQELCRVGKS